MKRPQFSLRDLIWLALLCAVGAGWYVDHKRQGEAMENSQAQIEALEKKQAELMRFMRFTGHMR